MGLWESYEDDDDDDFNDEDCDDELEDIAVCPSCGSDDISVLSEIEGMWECQDCGETYTVGDEDEG